MNGKATVYLNGNIRDCFVRLSLDFKRLIVDGTMLHLRLVSSLSQKGGIVSGFEFLQGKERIEMNPRFAKCLGIEECEIVNWFCISKRDWIVGSQVEVEVVSVDDSEVLELNQEIIEEQLLNQIRILAGGMRFPISVSKYTFVELIVLTPQKWSEIVWLDRNTEFLVKTKQRKRKKVLPKSIKRVKPSPDERVYLSGIDKPCYIELIHIQPEIRAFKKKRVVQQMKYISSCEAHPDENLMEDEILLPLYMVVKLQARWYDRLCVTILESIDFSVLQNILVVNINKKKECDLDDIQQQLMERNVIPAWSIVQNSCGEFLVLVNGNTETIQLSENNCVYQYSVQKEITYVNENAPPIPTKIDFDPVIYCEWIESDVNWKRTLLKLNQMNSQRIVITGKKGFGKTFLSRAFISLFEGCSIYISGGELVAELSEVSKLYLQSQFKYAASQPSLIVIDEFDLLVPKEQEEMPDVNIRYLSSILLDLLCQSNENVSVILTCESKENVHQLVSKSEILNSFAELQVNLPNDIQKRIMIENFQNRRNISVDEGEKEEICTLLSNYSAHDISQIFKRAFRYIKVSESLNRNHILKAMEGFVTQATEGIHLIQNNLSWEDIGGLKPVIQTIRETFEYPSQYSKLFERIPIKLRSGLLLYGPSGCGKSYLANVVAGACGLNFISVKGPELLNKYIGESEANVRRVFEQAEAAKPCILFFDEFESVAAKRGHDSTGTTDRVVNQFLCQMDGIESRTGVFVLAASSRPDLIDLALLRPGRIDKCLFCNFPTTEERYEILQVLSKDFSFEKGVNLQTIAEKTPNFSGADLQGLLNDARLRAINEYLETKTKQPKDGKDNIIKGGYSNLPNQDDLLSTIFKNYYSQHAKDIENKPKVTISQSHLNSALKTSKPSVGIGERTRLSQIYNDFQREMGETDSEKVDNRPTSPQRVTLT